MRKMNDFLSSRQSIYCTGGLRRYNQSSYSDMLLKDITNGYSFLLSSLTSDHKDSFDIQPANDRLEKLLSFHSYRWLEHELDDLLRDISYYLIINGKAYVEIVTWTNAKGKTDSKQTNSEEVIGLSLEPIFVKRGILLRGHYWFIGKDIKGDTVPFRVEKRRIICFDLKDLQIKRNYFVRLLKRLSRIDLLNSTELSLNPKLKGKYSFTDHAQKNDFLLLKYTRKVYWYGRRGDNQYLSESYLSYRAACFKLWRKGLLDYLIKKLNTGLKRFAQELNYDGNIITKEMDYDFQKEFLRYSKGEINTEQLTNIVFETIPNFV